MPQAAESVSGSGDTDCFICDHGETVVEDILWSKPFYLGETLPMDDPRFLVIADEPPLPPAVSFLIPPENPPPTRVGNNGSSQTSIRSPMSDAACVSSGRNPKLFFAPP